MSKSLSEKLVKAIEYLSLPFQYPSHFIELSWLVFSNRELVHELARLTPQRAWFKGLMLDTVIDVGAYIGSFAYAMRVLLPNAAIHSFDPLDANIQKLTRIFVKDGKFHCHQTALGDKKGTIDFWQSSFTASSSALEMDDLHKQTFPESSANMKIQVPVARLDDFLPEMNLGNKVLLKIDVQGYELAVLRGADDTLKRTQYVITEVSYRSLYKDQALFDNLYQYLVKKGFQFGGIFDSLTSPQDGAILQSDALFFKP